MVNNLMVRKIYNNRNNKNKKSILHFKSNNVEKLKILFTTKLVIKWIFSMPES